MATLPRRIGCLALAISLWSVGASSAANGNAATLEAAVSRALAAEGLRTGVLYDRVLPLSHIERFSGADDAAVIRPGEWRQLADELRRAADVPFTPQADAFVAAVRAARASGVVPLAVIRARYQRLERKASDAETRLAEHEVFAFTPLLEQTFRGADVRFRVDPAQWFANDETTPRPVRFDPDDGGGVRDVAPGEIVRVSYASAGTKSLWLSVDDAGGTRVARAAFRVAALVTPTPDDTLHLTASIPYNSVAGTGEAYVRLAPGHTRLVNPIVLVEGFDLDNSMNWDELYALMNTQGLADSLAADGLDAVVLNFTDATDAIQRNAFVVAELLGQVGDAIEPQATVGVIGASMGGLCSRYALAYMETHAMPHRVRTWISFDTPHGGADIPLGIQYWVDFFAGQSTEAATLRAQLNRPAARQMLVAHYTTPPTTTAAPDPARATLLQDFALVGNYPALARRVAVVNGSGTQMSQGFQPGAQLIRYEYSDLFVATTGNVWALRDQASQMVFDGRLRILFSTTTRQVTVSGSPAWDGAPGGWRASMAQMDAVVAPYGDIVALHPNHCFIPTVSALALATADPFYDVLGDPDLVSHTPFDAVYVPTVNQGHVEITAENAAWFRAELVQGVASAPAPAASAPVLALRASPNPFRDALRIELGAAGSTGATLEVFGLDGARVRSLVRTVSGERSLLWDGRDAIGRAVPPGIYFLRLSAPGGMAMRRVVKLR